MIFSCRLLFQKLKGWFNFMVRSGANKNMHTQISDLPVNVLNLFNDSFGRLLLLFSDYLCGYPKRLTGIMIYLTRLEHFNAAHRLYNPLWSRQQNDAVYGKCANDNWHGHNYELYVTVKGVADPDTGFLFDVKKLSTIIKDCVIEKIDHKNLNMDVDFLQGQICSTENLTVAIWQQLKPHLPQNVQLHCVKLYETPRIYVEYFGEE